MIGIGGVTGGTHLPAVLHVPKVSTGLHLRLQVADPSLFLALTILQTLTASFAQNSRETHDSPGNLEHSIGEVPVVECGEQVPFEALQHKLEHS